jgi:AmmeMemoRadiSam system protein B
MASASLRPRLRPIETIVVPDSRHGRVLVLRDTQGITSAEARIPPPLVPIVARFDGERTCDEIAREVSDEMGAEIPVEVVRRLAEQLDDALFLEGGQFKRALARVAQEFRDAKVRPASHAGGAYHDDAAKLRQYLDDDCIARAKSPRRRGGARPDAHTQTRRMVGLIAPHIDPWRGAIGYGHAYGALAGAISDEVDTFILFGTSHAPMREMFALCDKSFDTPLGVVSADHDAIGAIAKRVPFDPYADLLNHKREHSLEFQVVFLRHLLGERDIKIVPVLAGLGEHQARGTDPAKDDRANRFLDAVSELASARKGRVVVVAGADLAHVGPRFGDAAAYDDDERRALEETDRGSLACATRNDARAFWTDVAKDLATRRVCGLAPIYSLLRTLPGKTSGEVLHYEQNIDRDGSIVSHAAVGFFDVEA